MNTGKVTIRELLIDSDGYVMEELSRKVVSATDLNDEVNLTDSEINGPYKPDIQ